MNKIAIAFLPFLVAGFILPDDSCKKAPSNSINNIDQSDGPYVLYKGDKVYVKYILGIVRKMFAEVAAKEISSHRFLD